MALRDYLRPMTRYFTDPREVFAQRKLKTKKVAPTTEVAIADTRLNILNTVTLFPFNPDDLVRTKGGLEVYDRMLLDEQVRAALAFKKAAVIGSGWTLTPRGDTPEELLLTTTLEEDLKSLEGTFEDDLWEILAGLQFGFSICELVWMLDDGGPAKPRKFQPPPVEDPQKKAEDLPPTTVSPAPTPTSNAPDSPAGVPRLRLKAIKGKAPHRIDFKVDPYGNVVEIVQLQAWGRTPLPPEKFVHYVHNPEFDNPYGTSDLRAAYKPYFYKTQFLQYWAIWMEMSSVPVPIATYPKNDEDRAALVRSMLSQIQARTAITVPEGWTVEAFESRRDTAPFIESVDRMDMAIARAILVPEKLGLAGGAVQGGSFSLSRTQANTFLMVMQQISRRLAALVQHQIVDRMAANAMPGVPSPKFELNPVADEDRDVLVDLYLKAVAGGAVLAELEDENRLRTKLGWPERSGDESGSVGGPPGPMRKVASPVPRPVEGMSPGSQPQSSTTGRGTVGIVGSPSPGTLKASETFPTAREAATSETLPDTFWRALHPLEVRCDMVEKRDTLETLTRALATTLGEGAKALVHDIAARAKKLVGKPATTVRTLKPSGRVVTDLRSKMQALLEHAYARATQQAKAEVRRAKQQRFTEADMRLDFQAGLVGARANQFFRAQAFQVTGVLAQDVLEDAQNVLLRTLTQDKTTRQIEFELDQALGDYLPETDAAGNVVNIPARLETVARTNIARAVGEGRYATFTDPELDGFVQAFRYSAILDNRTTEGCRAWDGVTLPVDHPAWYSPEDKRPPNHWNCRSQIVPVTAVDEAELTPEDQLPRVSPVIAGFK